MYERLYQSFILEEYWFRLKRFIAIGTSRVIIGPVESGRELTLVLLMQAITLAIHHALDTFDYDTATFLAERLVAQDPSPGAAHMLARAVYLAGSPALARSLLDPTCAHLPSVLLFAQCSLKIADYIVGATCLSRLMAAPELVTATPVEWASCHALLGTLNRFALLM